MTKPTTDHHHGREKQRLVVALDCGRKARE